MVSKRNFQQNGRVNQQQRQMPYKKPPLKPPMMHNFNNPMFNVSQIPDNPGYLDFNLPTPPTTANNAPGNGPAVNKNAANGNGMAGAPQKKKNNKNRQKNKPPQAQQGNQQNGGGWINKNQGVVNSPRFNGVARNFPPMGNPRRSNRLMGPMGGPRGGMGIMGPQIPPPMGFQPPMIPPMPPMGRGGPPMGGPIPPPFMRRGNGPMPPPMPPMLPPRMARGMPPIPFNGPPMGGPGKINKKGKLNNKKVTKGKNTIKTLKNLINQYPLDKPWVNDEIRGEHDKKVDIENRLKGNKDDELFAQFKVQRDKFVALYEVAREEYLKKEAAAVKAKVT